MAGIDAGKGSRYEVRSLTQSCLECVTNNFERYNEAFLSSEDSTMQQNLLFLQLTFTPDLIKNLDIKEMLCNAYLEFLINEHLKELDIGCFLRNGCSWRCIKNRIAVVGHLFTKVVFDLESWADTFEFSFSCLRHLRNVELLTKVVFDSLSWTDTFELSFLFLCHLRNVEVLHIPHLCNDRALECISLFCTKLLELNIEHSHDITEKSLKLLCEKHKNKPECLIKILSMRLIIDKTEPDFEPYDDDSESDDDSDIFYLTDSSEEDDFLDFLPDLLSKEEDL
ncbi:hypothetical protein JTE90_016185 [Oedothorax gibbosus]|uniref:Uncharacterized protein n=1 Tax=Oedothorax gibbosus TaxID=931172 RepID=A0AAV6TQX3_9ARAC|nr:hypothetical protein JTE90_016185 [Oedothorax gibbosus]